MKHSFAGAAAAAALLALSVAGCGGKESAGTAGGPAQFLRTRLGAAEPTGEVRTFTGETLWEYIDGDAEMYRQYRFVEIATADYRFPEVEFIVDVYRFADDAGAYGLYAAVRPDEPDLLAIGTQGFCTESTVTAVKGRYLARLIAFDESSQTGAMLAVAADSLMRRLPGSTDRPAAFARFPDSARVPCGDRYYPASYLGQAFLTDVYEQAYALGPDTVRLFFAADSSGGKFLRWQEAAGAEKVQTDLPFDGGAALMIRSYADTAAAGLRQFTLAGMRAYAPRHRDFFARWLAALGG